MTTARRFDGTSRRLRAGALALAVSCALMGSGGGAFAQSDSAAKAELEVTFQKLLARPSDRALNRRLIDLAVQLKDYDTAIGGVERLIFYAPNDPALQLEAARLYYQIKSYAAAAGYVKEALAMRLTEAQRAEATLMLARVEKQTVPGIWQAFFQSGVRYQSNANVGSKELGINEPLPFDGPVSDWNSFAAATLSMNAPVSKYLALEAAASGYYSDQIKLNRLDLGFGEFTIGPRLMTADGALSLKPYAITQGVVIDRLPYQWAYGGGASIRYAFAENWFIEPSAEYKLRTYYNSDDYPTATDQNGRVLSAGVNFKGQFNERFAWTSRLNYTRNSADTDYQSYTQYLASISLLMNFDLFGLENWSFSPFAKFIYTDYGGIAPPEEFAQLTTVRADRQWGAGASLEIPLVDHFRLGIQVEYARNSSNLDRYTYDNLQVFTGPVVRF